MAITRTINYTQNIPVSLGFSNILTASASTVLSVVFNFESSSKMGTFLFDDTAGVTKAYQSASNDQIVMPTITLTGTTSALNTCLNSGMFQNHYYECENIEQGFLSQDRALPSDGRGEVQIQIPKDCVHGLSVGSNCQIKLTNSDVGVFTVTAIDNSNSATRLWLIFNSNYGIFDTFFGSMYKNAVITRDNAGNASQTGTVTKSYTACYLAEYTGTIIAPICDLSYNNPHGNFIVNASVYQGASLIDSGTISFNGSFFIAEPTFTSLPPNSISAPQAAAFYTLNMGAIAQTNNNYQSVQLLMKYLENDPAYLNVSSYSELSGYPATGTENQKNQFIGDAINAKASLNIPRYAENLSLGLFGNIQINDRISESPTTGVVRWHFYGTPSECNSALSKISYFRAPAMQNDFAIEIRIVNGRTRIYNSRGK